MKSKITFTAELILTPDRRKAQSALERYFDDVEVTADKDITTISVTTDLMPDDAEMRVNQVLFSLRLPAAERDWRSS